MKVKTKEKDTGQLLVFTPNDDLDIFLLGRIASKVKRYEMKAVRGDDKICMSNFSIRTDDLLKLLEREIGKINEL